MRKKLTALLVLIPVAAAAGIDNPEIPDEATKKAALLLAYELNGKSMDGRLRMIDLSGPPPAIVRTIPITPTEKKERKR
jgi:hypothetical protein